MAKTIKEMALEKFPDHPTNDELTRCRRLKRSGYEYGANAVLAEIETCLKEPSMIQGYSDILAKVQELKGD